MNIIERYLAINIAKAFAMTLLVLFVIVMSNALSDVLSDISLGEAPKQALIPLLMGQATSLIALLIPLSFFLGVMFAFGRLYKDYEMSVLNACGMGYERMFKSVLVLLIPLFVIDSFVSLSLDAQAKSYAQTMVKEFENQDEFEHIQARRFNVSDKGDHVFYMESMSDDRRLLQDVIINQSDKGVESIEMADFGAQVKDPETGDLFLEIGPGIRYEGTPGKADFKVIKYQKHGLLIDLNSKAGQQQLKPREKPLSSILSSTDKKDRIELQWRMVMPVMLIVLALMAVPLSYVAPRKGQYGKLGAAILVFILYNNFIGAALASMEDDEQLIQIGFWMVHGVFLILFTILLWLRNKGVFRISQVS